MKSGGNEETDEHGFQSVGSAATPSPTHVLHDLQEGRGSKVYSLLPCRMAVVGLYNTACMHLSVPVCDSKHGL